MFEVPGLSLQHSLLAASYLALYPACGVWVFTRPAPASRRLSPQPPCGFYWITCEPMQGFSLSPGGHFHTQHLNLPLLQLAAITGEYGVSFCGAGKPRGG